MHTNASQAERQGQRIAQVHKSLEGDNSPRLFWRSPIAQVQYEHQRGKLEISCASYKNVYSHKLGSSTWLFSHLGVNNKLWIHHHNNKEWLFHLNPCPPRLRTAFSIPDQSIMAAAQRCLDGLTTCTCERGSPGPSSVQSEDGGKDGDRRPLCHGE